MDLVITQTISIEISNVSIATKLIMDGSNGSSLVTYVECIRVTLSPTSHGSLPITPVSIHQTQTFNVSKLLGHLGICILQSIFTISLIIPTNDRSNLWLNRFQYLGVLLGRQTIMLDKLLDLLRHTLYDIITVMGG